MGLTEKFGSTVLKMGNFYSFSTDRKLTKHLSNVNVSNGMAWTEDNQTLYYTDTRPKKIVYAFDFDITEEKISNQRVVYDYGDDSVPAPDGMTIDITGKLWVTSSRGGEVRCIDPVTGQLLRTIELPTKTTTSCCFGGPNLDELYVTSARSMISEEELKNKQVLAGSVFRVTGLGAKGFPANLFKG